MIGSLKGTVLHFDGNAVIVQCASGVGYEVEVPAHLRTGLKEGGECFLYVVHIVREDAQLLFGFPDLATKTMFKEIIRVNGIGPKIAMSILSTMAVGDFVLSVLGGKTAALTQAPGVGKKMAERIVVEMKDRLSRFDAGPDLEEAAGARGKGTLDPDIIDEALSALTGLGYRENVAQSLIKQVYKKGMDTKAVIVAALALIARSKG